MDDRCQPAPNERRGDADAESERYEKGRHRAGAVGGSAQSGGGHAWESRETIQVRESLAYLRVVIGSRLISLRLRYRRDRTLKPEALVAMDDSRLIC